jgi:hypothetical protein
LIAHGDDKGLFIVMDYAEGRHGEVRAVAEQLSRRLEGDTRPIRLVLLTRSAGDWWIALHDETPEVQNVFRRAHCRASYRRTGLLGFGGARCFAKKCSASITSRAAENPVSHSRRRRSLSVSRST